jgi:hypothetical protein
MNISNKISNSPERQFPSPLNINSIPNQSSQSFALAGTTSIKTKSKKNFKLGEAVLSGMLAAFLGSWANFFISENAGHRELRKAVEERFLTSAKLIGDKNINVRSASIIGMKGIFKDSEDKQWEIVQILASLIRVNSQSVTHPSSSKIEVVPVDVKMALDVIKSRDPKKDNTGKKEDQDRIINLTGAKLYGADLEYSQLPKADFSDADLTRVNLSNADLTGSFLRRTNLTAAILDKTILKGANIKGAILTDAIYTLEQIKQACYWEEAIDKKKDIPKIARNTKEKSSARIECKKFK